MFLVCLCDHGVMMALIVKWYTAFAVATLGGWAQVFHAVRQTNCCKETEDKQKCGTVYQTSPWAHASLAVVTIDGYT